MNEKKNSKRNRMLLLLILLVGFISIGYAALSTTLNINGTSRINNAKWSVHFDGDDGATITGTGSSETVVVNTAPTITKGTLSGDSSQTSGDSISYDVTLGTPGDKYEFVAKIVNDGSIDTRIAENGVSLTGVEGTTHANYAKYTVVYASGEKEGQPLSAGDKLAHGEEVSVKVTVEFLKDIDSSKLPTSNTPMNLTFSVEFVQD